MYFILYKKDFYFKQILFKITIHQESWKIHAVKKIIPALNHQVS